MKLLATIILSILAFCFGFYLDSKFIEWVLTQMPTAWADYLGLIKVLLWIITFSITFAVSVGLGVLVCGVLMIILKIDE